MWLPGCIHPPQLSKETLYKETCRGNFILKNNSGRYTLNLANSDNRSLILAPAFDFYTEQGSDFVQQGIASQPVRRGETAPMTTLSTYIWREHCIKKIWSCLSNETLNGNYNYTMNAKYKVNHWGQKPAVTLLCTGWLFKACCSFGITAVIDVTAWFCLWLLMRTPVITSFIWLWPEVQLGWEMWTLIFLPCDSANLLTWGQAHRFA